MVIFFSNCEVCVSLRSSPVPSHTAVLSCAVEYIYIYIYVCDLPQWFHVFASRSGFKHIYICVCEWSVRVFVFVFVFVTVCVLSVSGRERRGGVVVVAGGSVCCVCRSLDSNLTADSLRSVPQDKSGAQQLHQVKRMI